MHRRRNTLSYLVLSVFTRPPLLPLFYQGEQRGRRAHGQSTTAAPAPLRQEQRVGQRKSASRRRPRQPGGATSVHRYIHLGNFLVRPMQRIYV